MRERSIEQATIEHARAVHSVHLLVPGCLRRDIDEAASQELA